MRAKTIFIKFDYNDSNGPTAEIYELNINEDTTIKDIKQDLNNHYLYGNDLNLSQYELYKGGETYIKSRAGADYFTYEEPILLNDDDKLNDIDKLILKVKITIKN